MILIRCVTPLTGGLSLMQKFIDPTCIAAAG
jgi:hypothetical protein